MGKTSVNGSALRGQESKTSNSNPVNLIIKPTTKESGLTTDLQQSTTEG